MSDDTEQGAAEPSALDKVQARRKARKDAARKVEEDALAVDLDNISEIEDRLGDANVATVRVAYVSADVPVAASVRCPKPAEHKRYRDRCKPSKDSRNRDVEPDYFKAAEELAAVCLVYPDAELYARMCSARPGLATSLGVAAAKLASAADEAEGKE
jgi:hypothetical protein